MPRRKTATARWLPAWTRGWKPVTSGSTRCSPSPRSARGLGVGGLCRSADAASLPLIDPAHAERADILVERDAGVAVALVAGATDAPEVPGWLVGDRPRRAVDRLLGGVHLLLFRAAAVRVVDVCTARRRSA